MFQKNLNSYYYLFQVLFFSSTFVVQTWGQENGSLTADGSNILLIIGLVGGCVFMVTVCVITRSILSYFIITKYPKAPKPRKDTHVLDTTVAPEDSFTSDFYCNIKPGITPRYPPQYDSNQTGSIEALSRVENEFKGLDLNARKYSNDYDEIRHSQVKKPCKLEIVRSLTPQPNRTSPANNEYVIDQITPTNDYVGMLAVTTDDYEGMKSIGSEYVIDSISSDPEVAYYSIQPNLEYDYITIAEPQQVTAIKPNVAPKPSCCVIPRSNTYA